MAAIQFAPQLFNWIVVYWGWSALFGYALLGVLIEYFKNIVMRIGGWRYSHDVDAVLTLSFAAALGFVTFENLFLFLNEYASGASYVAMLKFTLFRQFFVLPVHLVCSGVFGYFYGVGRFASKDFARTDFAWVQLLFVWLPRRHRHRVARIVSGTVISVVTYALFFTVLKLDPTAGDLLRGLGLWDFAGTPLFVLMSEPITILFAFLFSTIATTLFFLLLDRKRDFVRLGKLLNKDEI